MGVSRRRASGATDERGTHRCRVVVKKSGERAARRWGQADKVAIPGVVWS